MGNSVDISVRVITVSDRSAEGEREDRSGPAAVAALSEAGLRETSLEVIPDGAAVVKTAIGEAIDQGAEVVLTLGGTGVGPRDQTPEGTRSLIERELPGISEGLRAAGATNIATAVLSRGIAGVARHPSSGRQAVVVNLPGSVGGARDGIEYLVPILPHLLDQLRGGDH